MDISTTIPATIQQEKSVEEWIFPNRPTLYSPDDTSRQKTQSPVTADLFIERRFSDLSDLSHHDGTDSVILSEVGDGNYSLMDSDSEFESIQDDKEETNGNISCTVPADMDESARPSVAERITDNEHTFQMVGVQKDPSLGQLMLSVSTGLPDSARIRGHSRRRSSVESASEDDPLSESLRSDPIVQPVGPTSSLRRNDDDWSDVGEKTSIGPSDIDVETRMEAYDPQMAHHGPNELAKDGCESIHKWHSEVEDGAQSALQAGNGVKNINQSYAAVDDGATKTNESYARLQKPDAKSAEDHQTARSAKPLMGHFDPVQLGKAIAASLITDLSELVCSQTQELQRSVEQLTARNQALEQDVRDLQQRSEMMLMEQTAKARLDDTKADGSARQYRRNQPIDSAGRAYQIDRRNTSRPSRTSWDGYHRQQIQGVSARPSTVGAPYSVPNSSIMSTPPPQGQFDRSIAPYPWITEPETNQPPSIPVYPPIQTTGPYSQPARFEPSPKSDLSQIACPYGCPTCTETIREKYNPQFAQSVMTGKRQVGSKVRLPHEERWGRSNATFVVDPRSNLDIQLNYT